MDNGNRQLVLIKISKFPDGKLKSKLQWPQVRPSKYATTGIIFQPPEEATSGFVCNR